VPLNACKLNTQNFGGDQSTFFNDKSPQCSGLLKFNFSIWRLATDLADVTTDTTGLQFGASLFRIHLFFKAAKANAIEHAF
jgi:hypothetical protein